LPCLLHAVNIDTRYVKYGIAVVRFGRFTNESNSSAWHAHSHRKGFGFDAVPFSFLVEATLTEYEVSGIRPSVPVISRILKLEAFAVLHCFGVIPEIHLDTGGSIEIHIGVHAGEIARFF